MKLRHALLAAIGLLLGAALIVQAQVPGVNSTLQSVFTLAYDNSTMKPTYSASTQVVPAASATDLCTLTGSATKNIRVRRILVNGIANAVVNVQFAVVKRSTANSGGTSSSPTVVPYDSQSSAGTAVMRAYTVNPTTGTTVGIVAEQYIALGNATTGAVQSGWSVYEFGQLGSPLVLRGVAEVAALNLATTTISSGIITCTFEWTEE